MISGSGTSATVRHGDEHHQCLSLHGPALPAVVADDVLPGVVILPRSSTDPFVTALAGDDGVVHVVLERATSDTMAHTMAEVPA